ncbi:MAG: hypothetical protein LBH11_05890 [Propionibacteriaceae bacterium]|nr:hypothetical protein [Propionibacteriaceae bacterium]
MATAVALLFTGCTGTPDDTVPSDTPNITRRPDAPFPPDFPEDVTLDSGNTHIAVGTWAIVALDDGTVVGVRLNDVWQGTPGLLGERMVSAEPGAPTVDLTVATPFFLSWSYVVVSGDPEAIPLAEAMPGLEGTLWRVSSALSDRDCPDHESSIERGIGIEVRHCLVSVSADGAVPRALIVQVPDAVAAPGEREYWFFDPPTQFGIIQSE